MKSLSDLKYDKSNRGCIIFSARAAVSTFILKQHLCWGSIYARVASMLEKQFCYRGQICMLELGSCLGSCVRLPIITSLFKLNNHKTTTQILLTYEDVHSRHILKMVNISKFEIGNSLKRVVKHTFFDHLT